MLQYVNKCDRFFNERKKKVDCFTKRVSFCNILFDYYWHFIYFFSIFFPSFNVTCSLINDSAYTQQIS